MDTKSISNRLGLKHTSVQAAIQLFEDGSTIPFVARYRKEKTNGLNEVELRNISEMMILLKDIDQRRDAITQILKKQGDLNDDIFKQLQNCESKVELEDIYSPFKKRKKSRADIARERGLKPLANEIEKQPRDRSSKDLARSFVNPSVGVPDIESAWQGARDIVAERIAYDSKKRLQIRNIVRQHGKLDVKKHSKLDNLEKVKDYIGNSGRIFSISSHRYLALCRAENKELVKLKVVVDQTRTLQQLLRRCRYFSNSPLGKEYELAAEDALKRLLIPTAERAVRSEAKVKADEEAIDVFERNLEALLMGAPLGSKSVLGIDPGIRTGCKVSMVDETGQFVAYQTMYFVGRKEKDVRKLLEMISKYSPEMIAIGNGTGGRDTEKVVRKALLDNGITHIQVVSVNEAGASIYSASDLARKELPDVDLTVRGAVSIARRLQDPLSELVKIDPKSIGVGQYQHDVDQVKLQRKLQQVVESCVNRVGVNLNNASEELLSYVSGIGPKMAQAIVSHRSANGRFRNRNELRNVKGLGKKTFEQCAGFLRIPDGDSPLDASGVHPESYHIVQKMSKKLNCSLTQLISNDILLSKINVKEYCETGTGVTTIQEIVDELAKPSRDPREVFDAPEFRDDVDDITDLQIGMQLEGIVTNVTNFGAFVDIGVHQDGLIHISKMSKRRITTPYDVIRVGQRVQVCVLSIDIEKRRISLSTEL